MAMHYDVLLPSPKSCEVGTLEVVAAIQGGKGIEPFGKLRRFEQFGLTHIERGDGELILPGRTVGIREGAMILTLPGIPHWFGPKQGNDWDECYAVFHGAIFEWLLGKLRLDQGPLVVDVGIFSRPSMLRGLATAEGNSGVWGVVDLLMELFKKVDTDSTRPGWIEVATNRLSQAESFSMPMDLLANELGLGYESFRKVFRNFVGMGPSAFREKRRLDFAKELLLRSELTCAQIADRLDYADAFTFSKAFKRVQGESPTAFRRRPH